MSLSTSQDQVAPSADVTATRAFLDHLFPAPRDFKVRLWDGTVVGGENGARYTLVLEHPGAARRMFELPVELAIGEAHFFGDFDIEGDMVAALDIKERARAAVSSPAGVLRLLSLRRALPRGERDADAHGPARLSGRRRSRERDREAIRYHYDVGNDFYALWLDARMVYTCAYYPTGDEALDEAQERKLDLVCRKLRLARGETLLDVGCGWGALAIHAARNYGVRAVGVTLSARQHELANRRIREAGLEGRVEVCHQDYRDMTGTFDKVAAIGILEHIGADCDAFFRHVHERLAPGGLFLNHAIGAAPHADAWRQHPPLRRLVHRHILGTGLIRERYVFPDGVLLPVSEANLSAERAGFEVRDVENLREHYARTLRSWVSRLEARRDEAVGLVGEAVYRVWRVYMAASAREFDLGTINLNQTLFVRPVEGRQCVPLSRSDLYRVELNGGPNGGPNGDRNGSPRADA
ncbi:class I SAM-dependent methyltransferase [soil metagenome]